MLANTGLWVALAAAGTVWVLLALVIVASVVVGGRAERRYREPRDHAERTRPIYSRGGDPYGASRVSGAGASAKGGRTTR